MDSNACQPIDGPDISMKRTLGILLVLVFGLTVAPTAVSAQEDPRFETYVPEPTLAPGQTTQLTVQLVNDAEDVDDRVETARNVKATMKDGSTPFSVKSGTKLLGQMQDGQPVNAQFTVEAPMNVDPGTYRLPIELSYEFENDESETDTVYAEVRIEDRAYFALEDTSASIPVGDSGNVTMTFRNVGTKTAHDASISTRTTSGEVTFGQAESASEFVGTWEPGENRTVTFDLRASNDASARTYRLVSTVNYEDSNGNARESSPLESGIRLQGAQSFSFSEVSSTLRVGEKGTVVATVTNDGPRPVSDAVLTLGETPETLQPQQTEYGLGDLAVGDSTTVRFPINVAATAEPSPRRLPFVVSYRNVNDDLQETDRQYLTADVAEERDRFGLEVTSSNLRVGSEGTLELTVANNGDAVEDVVVKIRQPGQNVHPQETDYAIGSMAPDRTEQISFPIEVSDNGEAVPRQFSFVVNYEDGDGDDSEAGPYNVRVDIDERKDRFLVEPVSATKTAGETGPIEVNVTNNGDEPITNINAKIFADEPLSAEDDEAYIDSLDPGESATVTFSVGVSESALTKSYPLSMDFQYDEGGDTKLSETYQVPVTVTENEQSGFPIPLVVATVIVLALIGGYLYYRRTG